MAIFEFDGYRPQIGKNCYIADSAEVIGAVTLGEGCYVGPGAKIRGDYGVVHIGNNTGVEENVVIHARPGETCTIGNWVTLGHGCIIHNVAKIDDYAVIGMGAIVSDWAKIGQWAAVGEGALVVNRQEIAPGMVAVGVPCKVVAEIRDDWKKTWETFKAYYVNFAHTYRERLKKIE
ncbi:MAG: gamma carbonic anhydrase family protein [Myxococcales bacterium]|nr:MAG: gamma carbonic anhydrase family protein [Myxococcales bacterium]